MDGNWLVDIRKYDAVPDEAAIAGIVSHCVSRARESQALDLADPSHWTEVRETFLKFQLGLAEPGAQLDAAIAAVAKRVAADRQASRVTVYYLLAEHFGRLERLHEEVVAEPDAGHPAIGAGGSGALGAVGEALAFTAGAPIAGVAEGVIQVGEVLAEAEARFQSAITGHHAPGGTVPRRSNWPWIVIGLLLLGLIAWLLLASR